MVFREDNTRQGLIQECERITGLGTGGITGNSNLLKDFTARLNNAVDRFYALVFEYDAQWNYDDRNQTGLPIGCTNLNSGQQDYRFSEELLAVTQVFVKDQSGTYQELHPQDDRNEPRTFDLTSGPGLPKTYKLIGNSIMLDPIPNYTLPNDGEGKNYGLKVIYKRNGNRFNFDDGAVKPGIPSLFCPYLAREACQSWLQDKGRANKNDNFKDILRDEEAIKRFISNRAKSKSSGLRVRQESNR
jgi:hypothetical protein